MPDTSERIIILTALLLIVVIVTAPIFQDKTEVIIEETTSNIIFRYGSSRGEHPNELDTFKGKFTKEKVNMEPVWIRLDFTQEEMDTINRKMAEIDFLSYPKRFQPEPKLEGKLLSQRTPFTVYYLEHHDESGTKVVYWTTTYDAPKDIQYQNLNELATLIIEMIQAKPEYQILLDPSAGYA